MGITEPQIDSTLAGRILRAATPERARPLLRSVAGRCSRWPVIGFVRFGSFRRTSPVGPIWPGSFGQGVDRVYIDRFLELEAESIHGDVLEVGGLHYANRFGADRITTKSILYSPIGAGPEVTYAADLADAPEIPSSRFDCIVLPQTLLFIYDVHAAVRTLHRILRPGGVVLVTVPGITQTVANDKERWGQYWSFTDQSLERLFGDVFGVDNVTVEAHGTVKTTIALLHGLTVEDLRAADFETNDPDFPLILTVKATR